MNTLSIETNPQSVDPTLSDWTPNQFDFNGIEMSVRIDEINVDPTYQMRAEGTNPDVVTRYAEIMKQNDPDGWLAFPLIKLLRRQGEDGSHRDLFLISGFHRLDAMKQNGYSEIQAVVSAGTHLDAIILSAGENADRSQPRTNADIQNIVEMFLTDSEFCQWGNAQIARWAQVTRQTVANHEHRLRSNAKLAFDRPEKLKFIDKHGNVSLRKVPSSPKADRFPPPLTAELKHEKFDAMIRYRDAAYDCWKAYCEKWGIEGNWESVCLDAEKHLDGEGCLSLPHIEENTLDEINAKSLTWQKMESAIENEPDWIYAYRKPLAGLTREERRAKNNEEEAPNLSQPTELSDSEPKEEKPRGPTWMQIIFHGQHHTGEIDRHVFRVDTPMADEYIVPIANAAIEAAKEAYTRLSTEKEEEQKPQLGFETVKYIKEPVIGG